MSDNTENLVLEQLRHIRKTVDDTHFDVKDLKKRATTSEENLAGIQRRLDRVDEWLERIEIRLNLVEA